jgi:hypothetical protein
MKKSESCKPEILARWSNTSGEKEYRVVHRKNRGEPSTFTFEQLEVDALDAFRWTDFLTLIVDKNDETFIWEFPDEEAGKEALGCLLQALLTKRLILTTG